MSGPLFFSALASGHLSHPALGSLSPGIKNFPEKACRNTISYFTFLPNLTILFI